MTLDRDLTRYEIEVAETLTARRDSALRLRDALEFDVAGFEDGITAVREGRALDILEATYAGEIRQRMSDALLDFEAARHRFRLAMVALAMDDGRSARQIGDAFKFSRQLASRYLKEARATWPELRGTVGDAYEDAGPGADPSEGEAGEADGSPPAT